MAIETPKIRDAGPVLIAGIAGIAMGMAIAKKMMGASPMAKMMGMCAEMLTMVRQTNALAVFATPEIQPIFTEWLNQLEERQPRCSTRAATMLPRSRAHLE